MTWLTKLPGFRRAPAGLEWVVLRRLPLITLVGTLLPVAAALAAGAWFGETDPKLATLLQIVLVPCWCCTGRWCSRWRCCA
jgi:hypothetical protein